MAEYSVVNSKQKLEIKVGVKVKKLLDTCCYGTRYPKDHRFGPERMNINTSMSHAKRHENKQSEKDDVSRCFVPFPKSLHA